jgi:GNAT superfamily N-acetyltransferase
LSTESKIKQWIESLTKKGLGTNLIIKENGSVVGFSVFGPARDKDLANKNCGELVALNILPEYWSKGFGSELIQYVIEVSKKRKWDTLYLWVIKQNTRAKSVYEGFGFVEDGSEKEDTKLTGRNGSVPYKVNRNFSHWMWI